MEGINIVLLLFSIISTAILLHTSLFIGFSLVDINIKEIIWKIISVSIIVSIIFEGLMLFAHNDIYLIIRYIIFIPIALY